MQNHLKDQTSPYLLQHADNPVHWYPWCNEAFEKAKTEDKPILLSIGYSTCHWCHVMAHESFEDAEVADVLNRYFISIKVDKEERPDIDSIYMSVCQAFTGSGGWPTTIFMTPEQKPFFAGTYFPKTRRFGQIGFIELLAAIQKKWKTDRETLLQSAEEIVSFLNKETKAASGNKANEMTDEKMQKSSGINAKLPDTAYALFQRTFDKDYGGFGEAPKFPTPHNLLFLMQYYERSREEDALQMAEKTLLQMYRGGMFDHIGGGFSRYSTDRYFLAPHFEKMLYDNALLIMAYSKAYQLTGKCIYRDVARKTACYVLREMTSPEGGFYSAQDADSEGEEGKYYLFEPEEIISLLWQEAGMDFNRYFDITQNGNFEGKNIPNLLHNENIDENHHMCRKILYEYRKQRYHLHLDDKILTSWNALMITAMCHLYRVTEDETYLSVAKKAQEFIEKQLCDSEILYVSWCNGQKSQKGFLDDYSFYVFALLALYDATLENAYLVKAKAFCKRAVDEFYDEENSGFFLYGKDNEQLILRPKETYDGAVFSGNSAMAYNLVKLFHLTGEKQYENLSAHQLAFMSREAERYPAGYAFALIALSNYFNPPDYSTYCCQDGNCQPPMTLL